jgi:Uma2 family endonuclease
MAGWREVKMTVAQLVEPTTYRWTREEFYELADLGCFQDRRVELIEGEIIDMPVPGNPHCISTECVAEALRNAFGKSHWVRVQMPLNLSPYSDAEPDAAVVPGTPRDYTDHPTTALLVVEVSDTTLSFDRGRKASLYARAGISDYWIVSLVNHQVEIRRQPAPASNREYGYGYADLTILSPGDHVAPLALPQAQIAVADLLP